MQKSFVVIKKGGVQHIVSPGDEIVLNRLDGDEGSEITIDDVYLFQNKDETIVGTPKTGHEVKAEIVEHYKGPKMYVRIYKAKSRYRRKKGHRQLLTRLKIKEITDKEGKTILKASLEAKSSKTESKKDNKNSSKEKKAKKKSNNSKSSKSGTEDSKKADKPTKKSKK
jgi:large subunit ribosomal protein L21